MYFARINFRTAGNLCAIAFGTVCNAWRDDSPGFGVPGIWCIVFGSALFAHACLRLYGKSKLRYTLVFIVPDHTHCSARVGKTR